jgi:serine/threonine-protein kinase
VLHRDLKPANVMIDGRGRARITDFGLAALGGVEAGDEARLGTPAYMAPEQLAGREVTLRSDVYALGLVLYEMFAGKPPFKAANAAELRELQTGTEPASPSSVAGGMDPAVERVILRCLDPEPSRRPSSALAVIAALPGGDPLAAAVAAGETPSPELVAAAGEGGAVRPGIAAAAAAATLAGVILTVFLARDSQLVRLAPIEKSPEVLTEKAREIIRDMGYTEPFVDSLAAFTIDGEVVSRLQRESAGPGARAVYGRARPGAVLFRYRQSPRYLQRAHSASTGDWFIDPPPTLPGMIEIGLDLRGRLTMLRVTPPERRAMDGPPGEPDWRPALLAAGLDPDILEEAETSSVPPVFADRLAAWSGHEPGEPDVPTLVEAAALGGRIVAFRVTEPPGSGAASAGGKPPSRLEVDTLVQGVVFFAVIGGAIILARRNLRHGRGDVKGALRFAAYMALVRLLWMLGAHHLPTSAEIDLLISNMVWAIYRFGLAALIYLAIEPYVRRLWPRILVSWTRLLHGRFTDPLVGRDALAGCALGVLGALTTYVFIGSAPRLGLEPSPPLQGLWAMESIRGLRHAFAAVAAVHTSSTLGIFVPLTFCLFLTLITRRTWLAVGVTSLLGLTVFYPGSGSVAFYVATLVPFLAAFWYCLFRFGFLSAIIGMTVGDLLREMPLTFDLSAPYAGASLLTLALVAGLTLFAFRASLGGRPLIRDTLLDPHPAR